jgi:hypothetical protein
VRNALRGPKRLCVLRSVKRKKNVQGGVQDKVGCTTMVSTVVGLEVGGLAGGWEANSPA